MTTLIRKLIRLPKLKQLFDVTSNEYFFAKMRKGNSRYDPRFPLPIKIGKRAIAWDASEIAAYQQALLDERDSQIEE